MRTQQCYNDLISDIRAKGSYYITDKNEKVRCIIHNLSCIRITKNSVIEKNNIIGLYLDKEDLQNLKTVYLDHNTNIINFNEINLTKIQILYESR